MRDRGGAAPLIAALVNIGAVPVAAAADDRRSGGRQAGGLRGMSCAKFLKAHSGVSPCVLR